MSGPARSIFVYAIYVFGLGATLLLVPNVPLPIFGLPEATEVWIRVAGMTVIFLSIFYFVAARYEYRADLRRQRAHPVRRPGLLRGLRAGRLRALEPDPVHASRRRIRRLDVDRPPARECRAGHRQPAISPGSLNLATTAGSSKTLIRAICSPSASRRTTA